MDQGHPRLNSNQDVNNGLLMDVCELSVCQGNLIYDVCKSTKILQQQSAPLGGDSESVLSKFRQRFDQLSQGADAKDRVLHVGRGKRFMQLCQELKDSEPDEGKLCQFLTLFYELFDSELPKYRSSPALRNYKADETITIKSPRNDCFKESTSSIGNSVNKQVKTEDYKSIEGFICEKGVAEVIGSQKNEKSDLLNSKDSIELLDSDDDKVQETISNIPVNDFDSLSDNTRNCAISPCESDDNVENYILNYELRRKKSIGKYSLTNECLGDLSQRTLISLSTPNHNSSVISNNSFLDEEYDTERLSSTIRSTENSPTKDIHSLVKNVQLPEILQASGSQLQTEELPLVAGNKSILSSIPEAREESEEELLSPKFQELRQIVSNIKTNILRKIDQSLSVLSQSETELSEEYVKVVEVPMKNHAGNYEDGKLIRKVKESVREQSPAEKVHWEHQQHIIIAPRVIIQLFKTNPAYKCAQPQTFYDQVNQLFEIIGQRNSSQKLPFEARTIQSRLIQILHQIKRELPRNISYSEWVAAVGKYQLNQLLSSEEMHAYESLCRNLRDDEGTSSQSPTTKESRFRDALRAMMGQESQHLKASSATGRLQIRSPHHQESVGESYLLLSLGLLGYLYRSLKDQLNTLEQRGATGACFVRSLRKMLHSFLEFLSRKENQPSSLLRLYWQTREYQLLFQWLLEVLVKINQNQEKAIIVSLYEESCRRTGEQWRLLQMWLSEVSKPLVSKLGCWLTLGQLTASDNDEFIIARSFTSGPDDFWQQRYRLTAPLSKLFNNQLTETMICVGKTVAYSKKYLGRNVEPTLSSSDLNSKLLHLLTHFYQHGDQEPLYHFLHKLHWDVSGKVLSFLRDMNPPPMVLLYQIHKYLMITDMHFYKELMQTLDGVLREPASAFNLNLFNVLLRQMLSRRTPDLFVDRIASQGPKCWSCFLLRLRLPDYWRALLGEENIKEYEAIFSGLWKFHYANFVLSEMVARRQLHFANRTRPKHFDCIDQVDQLFDILFDLFMNAMNVLKNYLLTDLLEPAYSKLRQDCDEATTLDDMLSANERYLRTIKLGSFQTRGLRQCNMYLKQLYDGIMQLDFHEQRFHCLLQNFKDYLTKYGGQTIGRSQFLIPSYELSERKREFNWSCQNSVDALINLKDKFHKVMLDLLFRLNFEDIESIRRLAQRLDRNGYYERMDQRLQLVQRFEFKRKKQGRAFVKNSHCSKQ